MIFQKRWLDEILAGQKTLELRRTRCTLGLTWLGYGQNIYGRARNTSLQELSPETFEKLRDKLARAKKEGGGSKTRWGSKKNVGGSKYVTLFSKVLVVANLSLSPFGSFGFWDLQWIYYETQYIQVFLKVGL